MAVYSDPCFARTSRLRALSISWLLPVLAAALATMPRCGAADPAADRPGTAQRHGEIAWGPMVDGRQAGLRLVSPAGIYALGEPVLQEVYVRNAGPNEMVVQSTGGYENQGAPSVRNPSGKAVKVLRYFGVGAMFVVTKRVYPGEIAVVERVALAFRLSDGLAEREVAPGISHAAEGMPLALAGPGTYRLRQEVLPMAADGKTALPPLVTGEIAVTITAQAVPPNLAAARDEITDVSTAAIAWGPETGGLRAGLVFLSGRSEFALGERVRLAVILRNVSSRPISFEHETSFAHLAPPAVTDAEGRVIPSQVKVETEWRTLGELRMTGVTYDMTYAPSADGASRLVQSQILPGQSVLGYSLTAFVVPRSERDAASRRSRVRQVLPVRLAGSERDLSTGALDITLFDPDRSAISGVSPAEHGP